MSTTINPTNVYSCDKCDKVYKTKATLRIHMKKHEQKLIPIDLTVSKEATVDNIEDISEEDELEDDNEGLGNVMGCYGTFI